MSDLINRISNYTYVLHPFNLKRTNKVFRNDTSQLKLKIIRTSLKETPADTEKLQAISTKTAIFIAKKHEKMNITVIQIRVLISFTLKFLPEIKKEKNSKINLELLSIFLNSWHSEKV